MPRDNAPPSALWGGTISSTLPRLDNVDQTPDSIFKQQKKPRGADTPELSYRRNPRKIEGAGNAGCALHPRSRVQKCTANAHEHTGTDGAIRHSLHNGFTAYSALSPVTGLFCHRRSCGNRYPRKLDTSVGVSGPHDFAVRLSHARQSQLSRPPHPAPTLVTLANAPLSERDGGVLDSIWAGGKGKYFCNQDWTGQISLNRFNKSGFWRSGYLLILPGREAKIFCKRAEQSDH